MPSVQTEKTFRHKSQTPPPVCQNSSLLGQHDFGLVSMPLSGPSHSPMSVGQLPRLITQVGPRGAQRDAKWMQGPRLMASALGTELPVRVAPLSIADTEAAEQPCEHKSKRTFRSSRKVGVGRVSRSGLSVEELLRKLTTDRKHRGPRVYYLKEVDQQVWRPYDLRVVPPTEAGSEHYIFCASCVIHVTDSGHGGMISLAEWYRESVYWTALQKITFFTQFKLRKAFFWWHLHVRRKCFLLRCHNLQDRILTDVSVFRNALLYIAKVTEEVKVSHWLPQNESSSYRLVEFSAALQNQKEKFQSVLQKLSHFRYTVLQTVKDECLRSHQELCSHIGYAQQAKLFSGPIFLHMAHQLELKKNLRRAENTLNKFSSFVRLINHMTVQSLIICLEKDTRHFLHRVVQPQASLFQTELTISAQQQLTVEPGPHRFLSVLREVLLTAKDFILESCDSCDFFDESSSEDLAFSCAPDLDFVKQALKNDSETSASTTEVTEFICCLLAKDRCSQVQLQHPGTEGALTLNRELLEWHLSMCDLGQPVEAAAAMIMREGSDLERLCHSLSWLLDIQEFVGKWSPVHMGALKGQSAVVYEEHILTVRRWLNTLHTLPSSLTTSNQLFNISCTSLKHTLEQHLQVIDAGLLMHLEEQVQLLSLSLISDLEKPDVDLQPRGQDFSEYAVKVRQWLCMCADMHKRLEHIRSLQEVICNNYRHMSEEECTRDRQVQDSWDHFLLLLKTAESEVCQDLPVHARSQDLMLLFLSRDLTEMVSQVSHEPYLDPTQDAQEMASRLRMLCAHLQTRLVRLEQLSTHNHNLQGHRPTDLTGLDGEIKKIEGRKDLWEVLASCTTWIEESNTLLFHEMEVVQAKKEMEEWRKKVRAVSGIPPDDAVLQKTVNVVEHLKHQLETLHQLKDPALKNKHWTAILRGIDLAHFQPQELTVSHLLSLNLERHQDLLNKICLDAKAECNMQHDFQHLQQQWAGHLLNVQCFCDSSEPQNDRHTCGEYTQTITDLEVHLARTKFDLAILSNMRKSPFSVDFRTQLEDWLLLLHKLDDLLHLFKRFQQMWTFLIKVFTCSSIDIHQSDLLENFQPVNQSFQKVMQHISNDQHLLHLVCSSDQTEDLHGDNLYQTLTAGLSTMETISSKMLELLDSLRSQCPRLRFLDDREVMLMFTSRPAPSTMLPFVRRLFKGVQDLEAGALQTCTASSNSQAQVKVWGILGSLQERITFPSPVNPSVSSIAWLCDFDKQLQTSMVEHMKECALVQEQFEPPELVLSAERRVEDAVLFNVLMKQCVKVLGLLGKHPSQCVLVAEEAVWCRVLEETFSHSAKVDNLKFYLKARLAVLGRFVRDGVALDRSQSVTPDRVGFFLRALVQMTMNHSEILFQLQRIQGQLHTSFEWLSLMKYKLSVKNSQPPLCFIDILGQRLAYGYEYVGLANWISLNSPSTDRAKLGILLALTNFRCGFVNGPKTVRKNLVVQLAMALGRMVFVLECGPNMRRVTVENFLLGSLQIGAWLLLDSVDLLSPRVSATLGKHFLDVHEAFSEITKESRASNQLPQTSLCDVVVNDKKVSASFNYGCVLLSSKQHMSAIPDDLQTAVRPVALTHPDYKVIAEVMFTSLGFVDAKFLSQRLECLLTLSQDCLYLPGCNTKNESCFLLILENIIYSSELYLEQCRKQRASLRGRESSQDKAGHFMRPSVFSVVRSVMEEAAVIKSILSVLLPFTSEEKKAEFLQLLKDTFPMVCQFPSLEHYLEEHEKNQVKAALCKVLQMSGLQPDAEILNNALTVYQNIKCGRVVILSGPSGSGKTSCYSLLAGALNALTVKSEENGRHSKTELKVEVPKSLVEPVVFFPNSMSLEEMLGHHCEQRGWQDGALTRILRDSALTRGHAGRVQTWLVLDGEPTGEPCWMDSLATLYYPTEPYLCLASGEHIIPSQAQLHILVEVTDLSSASPSTLTACSLVTFTGTALWKAVWRSQMHQLCSTHDFELTILEMWEFLAEDLFSATLCLLGQNSISSNSESRSPPNGLQEITSFFRILNALIQHFEVCLNVHACEDGKDSKNPGVSLPVFNTALATSENKTKMLARNCFLVAYSWGFGGHLHPSSWPRFHCVVREVLLKCRYRIQVPEGESVFEYFFTADRHVRLQTTVLTGHISPKYGVYTHLLDIMLEAKQSVLLAGEPGSGKTTLCRSLPRFNKPYVSLSGSAVRDPTHLYSVLQSCSAAKPSHMLLFVDDLHEASCDVIGKTPKALEALRQSVSKGGVVLFSNDRLQPLNTAAITYMATSSILGPPHGLGLPHRLTRLFSIFVLPSLSADVILSLYSTRLQLWMYPFIPNTPEIASCIISATHSLYLALCEHFRQTGDRSNVLFSIHDLQKVFQGMTLWQGDSSSTQKTNDGLASKAIFSPSMKKPNAILLNIVKLWLYECMHTFTDRLCEEDQHVSVERLMVDIGTTHFGSLLTSQGPKAQNCSEISSQPDISSPEAALTADSLQELIWQYIRDVKSFTAYSPELSELLKAGEKKVKSKQTSYKEFSLDFLTEQLSRYLNEQLYQEHHNTTKGFTQKYTVHRQGVRQLVHIFRVLLIPGAHAALIGPEAGTGRKTAVRCAALLTGCELLEVHSANEKELCEILRDASSRTRVEGVKVMVLVHEDVSLAVRDQLLVAMAQSYPGPCTQDQLSQHISTVTSCSLSKRYLLDHWMLDKHLGRIHKNIHIFLLLPHSSTPSDTKSSTEWNSLMRKTVSRCCCVEVYRAWSYESLVSVAGFCLQTSCPDIPEVKRSVSSLTEVMAHIHLSSCQYASTLLTQQNFSPSTYLHFIALFCELSERLQKLGLSRANRVEAVVSGLDVMSSTALDALLRQTEEAERINQEEQSMLKAMASQEQLLQDAQQTCVLEEARLCELEQDIQKTQLKLKSMFEAGVRKVTSLDLSDLEEVRGYRNPPEAVVLVLDAVCLLFQRPPGWDSAKHLLSQSNFFQELEYFDHYSLTRQQVHQLGLLVGSPHFEPELVREASQACESLCHWVLAVHQCCSLRQYVEVNQQLEAKAAATRDRLLQVRRQAEEARSCLTKLQLQLNSVRQQREEQKVMLQEAQRVHKEAASTVEKLGRYVSVWKDEAQRAVQTSEALPADALITAAIVSYLGAFGPDTRSELLSKWTQLCETGSIRRATEDPRRSPTAPCIPSAGFPLPVSDPLQQALARVLGLRVGQLPGQSISSLLIQLLLWSCSGKCLQHCSLLADPHHRLDSDSTSCSITGHNRLAMKEYGMEVCGDDPELLNKLEQAAVTGLTVLIKQAERAPPTPTLLSMLPRPGCVWPGSKQSHQPPHPYLVFSTQLPVHLLISEMHPSLLTRLRVVDLSLSSEEMESFMLTQLLHPECSELLSQRQQLQCNKQSLSEELCTHEDCVMDYIVQCERPLLEEPGLVHEVSVFHEETEELHSELERVEEALRCCEGALVSSQPLVALSGVVYSALQQVAVLSQAYFFSLDRFLAVVKTALSGKVLQLVSKPSVSGAVVEELSEQLVSHVLLSYRPCLLKSHVAVLRLLLCVALLQHRELCSQAESQAFLQGLLKSQEELTSCLVLPDWIPAHVYAELLRLEQLPAFRGLLSSLSTCPEQWQEYFSVPSSVIGLVPSGSFGQLSLLQRALLWKTVMPHSLQHIAGALATCLLHEPEPPCSGTLQALSQLLLQHRNPVIMATPSTCEPRGIQPLQLIQQLAHSVQVQVKVIGFEHSWEPESIVSILQSAVENNLWLVFKNCHLLEQWDRELLTEINRLTLDSTGSQLETDLAHFQMWFVAQEDQLHFIPLVVRTHALLFMSESCWSLKEELNRSLQQIEISRPSGAIGLCVIFHSVLLQRQARKGPGTRYRWSEADLLTLVVSCHIAALCTDQMGALQYMAVNLVHGGHVLDSADLEEVRSVARVFLNSGTDSTHYHHDVSALLQELNRSPRDPADKRERLLLGFGPDVWAEMLQVNSHNLNILLQASQCASEQQEFVCSEEDRLNDRSLRQRLWTLKAYISDRTGAPPAAGPLQDFLQSEWEQLSALVSSLVSKSELREQSELQHLERRAQLLSAYLWHHDSADPAQAYRLSAFSNPRGFLAVLRRESARTFDKNISDTALHFQVLVDGADVPPLSTEAVYLCGLELRGAAWDSQHGVTLDVPSAAPSPGPLICVSAAVGSTEHTPHQLYHCPLYVQPAGRDRLQQEPVTSVPLRSGLEPELCALRGVQLISRL